MRRGNLEIRSICERCECDGLLASAECSLAAFSDVLATIKMYDKEEVC